MQRVCGNIYDKVAQRPGSQGPEPAPGHQRAIRDSREKQPVAVDEEEGPLLGPKVNNQGTVEKKVESMEDIISETAERSSQRLWRERKDSTDLLKGFS